MVHEEEKREWPDEHKTIVNSIYGFGIGTLIIGVDFWFVFPHLTEDGITLIDATLMLMILFTGLAAAMPHVFKQILSHAVRRARNGRNGDSSK